jgi:hypothetical protein
MIDDHNNTLTSPTNSTVLINSPTSLISNSSSAIGVPSSQSAHNLISPNSNSNNNNQINSSSGGPLNNGNSNSQNGVIVSHSQSAHQIGIGGGHMTLQQQQPPHTPLAAHHQALQQQLQKHFANNNMGESKLTIPRRSIAIDCRAIFYDVVWGRLGSKF